ncbi:MAG: hypothetical protein U0401_05805 [Anaerolineae bacterium]
MKTQQIQFNRRRVAALLLAGSILAATAGLIWADVNLSQANQAAALNKADSVEYESGLSPESHLNAVKGGRPTGGGGGDVQK